jgi:hypothetical protein
MSNEKWIKEAERAAQDAVDKIKEELVTNGRQLNAERAAGQHMDWPKSR